VSIHSLRFRLFSLAVLTTLMALLLAGFGLVALFERHLERRFDSELEGYLNQLIGHTEVGTDGRIHVKGTPADPRFEEPQSGLYWQLQDERRPTLLRSRSLWDYVLPLPKDQLSIGEVHRHDLPGPSGQQLMVRERQVILEPDTLARRVRVAVARDRADLNAASQAFAADMLPYFALLALFLLAASGTQVYLGLSPLDVLRQGVLAVRDGRAARLTRRYPDEVMPLVEEINALLEARDATVEKARAWTADLAHGLKTPLAALTADAQRLREAGQLDTANDLEELALAMRRRVDRELIRARLRSAAAAGPYRADLLHSIERTLRTLARMPCGADLHWQTRLPDRAEVAMRDDDLAELLGNLLENACKWASTRVRMSVSGDTVRHLCIEDDGPGVAEEQLAQLGTRGARLDQQIQGHGLGLAIVRDIIESYQGEIRFRRSELGGLAVVVVFRPGGQGG